VGTQAVFGFGNWNGRSLTDNAPDVMLSIATNTPVRLGNWQRVRYVETFAILSLCPRSAGLNEVRGGARPSDTNFQTADEHDPEKCVAVFRKDHAQT
jgi:hypothetical protein